MAVAWVTLRAIVVCFASTIASGVKVPCPAGTRVYSLSVWSGKWLEGLVMRCTGDSDERAIPAELYEDGGGGKDEDICAGTAGVQSIHWSRHDGLYGLVHLNITCLDNTTYLFADALSYGSLDIFDNRTISCEEGEYVEGISYSVYYPDNHKFFSYHLTDLALMCSSSPLDAICTDCSGDTTLLSDEDQPEYCELPSCSEAECCEAITDGDTDSFTTEVIIGVVSNVAATIIISGSVWGFHEFKKKRARGEGVEDFSSGGAQSL